MTRINLALLSIALLWMASCPLQSATSDNFNDNIIGSQWTKLEDNASLQIDEQNDRLEITATAPNSPFFDAIYLSNGPSGFVLSTSQNFQISIDYNFSAATPTGGANSGVGLGFGVGRDLPDGTDSAAIGYGFGNLGSGFIINSLTVVSRTNDLQTNNFLNFNTQPSGTFEVLYDSAGDDLTFRLSGGSAPLTSFTLQNTVQGIWEATSLYVSIGGRGDGFTIASGNAYFDNFSVDSGLVLPIPEPTTWAVFGLGLVAMIALGRRFRLSGNI